MYKRRLLQLFAFVLWSANALGAMAAPPPINLRIELRQIEAANAAGGYVLSTAPSTPLLLSQDIRVRNGATARLQLTTSTPMQWVQKISAPSQNSGAGLTNGLVWLEAGQELKLTPHWPGGKSPVKTEVDIQSASVAERTGTELPPQSRDHLTTIINLRLGEWVTLASTGEATPTGVYSSSARNTTPRLLQIRVSLE